MTFYQGVRSTICLGVLFITGSLAIPPAVTAQWACGDCVGVTGIAHVFSSTGLVIGDRKCDQAGCHLDWYTGGCEVHALCPNRSIEAELEIKLLNSLNNDDHEAILNALDSFGPWSFNVTDNTIIIHDCTGDLTIARHPVPEHTSAFFYSAVHIVSTPMPSIGNNDPRPYMLVHPVISELYRSQLLGLIDISPSYR